MVYIHRRKKKLNSKVSLKTSENINTAVEKLAHVVQGGTQKFTTYRSSTLFDNYNSSNRVKKTVHNNEHW